MIKSGRRLAPIGRWLHLAFLSFILTPLVPSAGKAVEFLRARKLPAFLSALGTGALGFVAELMLAFGLPVSWWVYIVLHTVLSLSVGAMLLMIDRKYLPEAPGTISLEPVRWGVREVLTWGALFGIAASPAVLILNLFTTRWGRQFVLKPSFEARLVFITVVVFVPAGMLAGWLFRWRRPRHILLVTAAVLSAAAALPVPFLAGKAFSKVMVQNALGLTDRFSSGLLAHAALADVMNLLLTASAVIWLVFYLAASPKLKAFFIRLLLIVPIAIGFSVQAGLMRNTLPDSWRFQEGIKALAKKHWKDAAADFKWTLKRRATGGNSIPSMENLFAIALATRNGRLWREASTYARSDSRLMISASMLVPPGKGAKAPSAWLRTIIAPTRPVQPQSYLSDSWCAFLTAVRAALPRTSEDKLNFRLRALSSSTGKIELPPFRDMADLSMASKFFGLEPVPIKPRSLASLLRTGRPVLFYDIVLGKWGLIIGFDPVTQGILWYDYASYDRSRAVPLTRREINDLVAGRNDSAEDRGRVYAETVRVMYLPRLKEHLSLDGDPLFVLKREASPEDRRVVRNLVQRDLARRALWGGDPQRCAALLQRVPKGSVRAASLQQLADVLANPPEKRSDPAGVSADMVSAMDYWTLSFTSRRILRRLPLSDSVALDVYRRLSAENPYNETAHYWLMRLASKADNAGLTVAGARRYVLADDFSQESILDALANISALTDPGKAGKREMELLARHVKLMVKGDEDTKHYRGWSAPYCAARACIAKSRKESARWWSRAVTLAPKNPRYLKKYARVLASTGRKSQANQVLRQAALVTGGGAA